MIKLNLGCGKDIKSGYINLDIVDYGGNQICIFYPIPVNSGLVHNYKRSSIALGGHASKQSSQARHLALSNRIFRVWLSTVNAYVGQIVIHAPQ